VSGVQISKMRRFFRTLTPANQIRQPPFWKLDPFQNGNVLRRHAIEARL
jgi:hypothetical protein